ncbi:MAG: hypothetical protein K8S94_00175 [Planctomycetia bacterium]|nr:hypothetical protein [Planctomycetia bacterium]
MLQKAIDVNTSLITQTPLETISRLADELRAAYEQLVGGETVAAPAEIRVLVGEWNAKVLPAVNARIARCHQLVGRGLRDEAIGHALEQPDLFEVVKVLDLERFGRSNYAAWMEASRTAGLVAPVPPDLDKMAEVVVAQDRLHDIQELLDQWRRLNFRRAPLPARIGLLREIFERDPQEVWREMLREHESYRLMEIKAETSRIRDRMRQRTVDLEQAEHDVEQFVGELRGEWSQVKPADDLIDRVIRLAAETRQRRADATLDRLLPELEAAYAEIAIDRAAAGKKLARLHATWHATLADRGVCDPTDPRLMRASPILDYVTSLHEHRSLIFEVGHRVAERPATLRARGAWVDELIQMMDRVDDSATRLPAEDVDPNRIKELSDRVADITESVHREEWMRRALAVSTVVALFVGIAATAWGVFSWNRHRDEVAAALAACEEAVKRIEAGDGSGKDPVPDGSAAVREDPRVAAALERVASAAKKQADGREAFASQIGAIRKAVAELQAAPRLDPLAPWPEEFARVARLLDDVREQHTAVTDEERAQLELPAAALRTKAKEFTAAADDTFEDRVRRLEADLASVQLTLTNDARQARVTLDEVTASFDTLRFLSTKAACPAAASGYGGRRVVSASIAALVSSESKAATAINSLRARCAVVAGMEARESAADRLLIDGKYAEYADAIRKIADDVGSGGVARDYEAVARDHAEWLAIAEWQTFLASLDQPAKLTPEQAKGLLEKLRSLGPDVARSHGCKEARPWLEPALERASANMPEKVDELKGAFVTILESQHGERIDGVIWKRDVLPYPRYYCLLQDRPLADQKKSIRYVNGRPDAAREWPTKTLWFDAADYEVADSPQKSIALKCKSVTEAFSGGASAIDRLAIDVIRECSSEWQPPAGHPGLDPCLHAILVRFLVARACEASPSVKELLKKPLIDLNAGAAPDGQPLILKGVDNEVFTAVLDPQKQDDGAWVRANRAKCEAFVKLVAHEASEAARTIEARERDIEQRFRSLSHYRCVGRLRKRAEGGWAISGGDPVIRAGKRVLVAGGASEGSTMVPCVQCDANGGIPPGSDVNGRAGDPVFLEVSLDKKG